MNWRSPALLKAVRVLPCQNCMREDGTICAAHRNESKGMALKVSDALIAALCHKCHLELDQGKNWDRDTRRLIWNEAAIRTYQQLMERGILRLK